MGGDGDKVVTQPGANVPAYEMSAEEKRLLQLQSEMIETTMPQIRGYTEDVFPVEKQRTLDILGFTDPIMKGGRLPGEFGILGTDYGTDYEAEIFRRNNARAMATLNQLGILDSGATIEMARRTGLDVAMSSADKKRQELASLIGLAMGVPMSSLPVATSAAESAAGGVTGAGAGRREYELAAAQARAPRAIGYQQGTNPLGDIAGTIGGTVGGIGMSKFMFGIPCFTDEAKVKRPHDWKRIDKIRVGEYIDGPDKKLVEVLEIQVHPDTRYELAINGIKTTMSHPFVMADGTLKKAGDLNIGDLLFNNEQVEDITVFPGLPEEKTTLYNLIVEGHKYFVGHILVHDGMEVTVDA